MNNFINLIMGAIQIFLLDIMLSGDNVGVIALATRNLRKEHAKKASAIGIFAAVSLRILFSCMLVWVLAIQWLPIKLAGGILLIKITWDFIRPQEEDNSTNVGQSNKFWGAVVSIIIADATMSLDNVLAIASAANGNVGLVVFGLALSIPILFFGSQFVAEIMKKYAIAVYVGGAVLARTSINMIMEDHYIVSYVPHILSIILPLLAGVAVIFYGIYEIKKMKKPEGIEIFEAAEEAE